ncbi:MAG: ribbon-helix-helix domain-containing protein [Thermodesulfobacteriota bacterium]
MSNRKKQTIISFKADDTLAEALQSVPNRSEFIRSAILTALDNGCPLCQGSGILSQEQQKHWAEFLAHHSLTKCQKCQAVHLVCKAASETPDHRH